MFSLLLLFFLISCQKEIEGSIIEAKSHYSEVQTNDVPTDVTVFVPNLNEIDDFDNLPDEIPITTYKLRLISLDPLEFESNEYFQVDSYFDVSGNENFIFYPFGTDTIGLSLDSISDTNSIYKVVCDGEWSFNGITRRWGGGYCAHFVCKGGSIVDYPTYILCGDIVWDWAWGPIIKFEIH